MPLKNIPLSWVLIFVSALCDSFAAFMVKARFNELGKIELTSWQAVLLYIAAFLKAPLIWLAILAFLAAPALWFLALNRIDLSVAYPAMVGFHLLFVLGFGFLFLAESVTTNKMIAFGLIMSSLYFLYK